MASFVAEVLTSAGQLETQEATVKLQQLSKKIDSHKLEVYEITTNKYTNFLPQLHNTEQLVSDVEGFKTEMDDIANRIENQIKSQLNMSTGEFKSLNGQLEDVNSLLVVLEKIVNLQEGLEAIETAVRTQEYSKAADAVRLVKSLLDQKVFGHENEVTILSAIQTESNIQMQKLISDLSEKWKNMIQWTIPDDKQKNANSESGRKTELKINTKGEKADLLDKVVVGMKKMNILDEKMKRFGERLLMNVIEPIMTYSQCEVTESETGSSRILTVVVKNDDEMCCPAPQEMFGNLDKVLRFLNPNMLYVVIGEAVNENSDPCTLMTVLGDLIANQTLELAVKQCLIKAIPSSNKELEEFNRVIIMTEEVQKHLVKLCFIQSDNTILVDYIQNVNVLFANKKCQEILEKARRLMTTEVHNTVVVSHDKPLGELAPLMEGVAGSGGKKPRRDDLAVESPLSGNTFRLPKCHISTSIQELMTMAYETLREAGESSPQCAIQMFCAVRNMFELFCSVFPTYHKQSLETLPQFTALHYNNCMYISHHLMTLGHQFSKKLPQTINATFVDLVPKIRRLGTESFLQQLSKQKAQMLEYLAAANGFLNVSEKDAFFATERAVKQVLHQLQHLRKVWHEILPPTNYRKAIGGLLNGVIIEVTDSIVALEDISADDTKQLSRLVTTISARAPELFKVDDEEKTNITIEIQRNVAKWQRFRELDMVLNASMIEIGDRWASGKGPLAVVFTANEVKQLIRALFQNTDRRAAMLAKIK
ncbi:centromere/kinetochore protein zw10 homolog [Mercenaria mercenaria]|uniref:centromere/kinetochore protein zw10 homolog n=1 Tax=Mercenaria mercenaria TaxID=6596 RepID=UPI00234F919F|nr:centromere/kinetochore protein zw10 homolog [Mercenaria mercenaria]